MSEKLQINLLKPDLDIITDAANKAGIEIDTAIKFLKEYHLIVLGRRLDEKYVPLKAKEQ